MGMSEERELGFTFSSVKRRKNPCASISKESIGVSSSVTAFRWINNLKFAATQRFTRHLKLQDSDINL